jgi:hypothetical protein
MTTEEKKAKIIEHCAVTPCTACKLKCKDYCWIAYITDAQIEENYEILFGNDEPAPEQHFITAEPVEMEDDVDTVIKIKSSRPIDSVTIYFKEDK